MESDDDVCVLRLLWVGWACRCDWHSVPRCGLLACLEFVLQEWVAGVVHGLAVVDLLVEDGADEFCFVVHCVVGCFFGPL